MLVGYIAARFPSILALGSKGLAMSRVVSLSEEFSWHSGLVIVGVSIFPVKLERLMLFFGFLLEMFAKSILDFSATLQPKQEPQQPLILIISFLIFVKLIE